MFLFEKYGKICMLPLLIWSTVLKMNLRTLCGLFLAMQLFIKPTLETKIKYSVSLKRRLHNPLINFCNYSKNFSDSNTDGSLTTAVSNSSLSP